MNEIISKLLTETISEKELIELSRWLKDPQNQSTLESYIRDYHDLNLATLNTNIDTAFSKVIRHIDRVEKPVRRLIPNWVKYAAAILLLLGIGFIFQQGAFLSQKESVILSQNEHILGPQNEALIVLKNESITLELDNGEIQTIDVSQTKKLRDANGNIIGSQKQDQLRYAEAAYSEELMFNTLTIPKGKRFELELSDGTLVHLNAGSSFRYPINFLSESNREVFLSGEAYFDVAEDKSSPFIIRADELDVNVLGTEFYVSAYPEDSVIEVVLIEGSVSMKSHDDSQNKSTNLLPGQIGSFEHASNKISLDQVVNTASYTSWRKGHLVFRGLSFDSILQKLERHYNIEIENTNAELGREVFNASFNDVKIETVLSFFNDAHKIDYTIKDNKVIIN